MRRVARAPRSAGQRACAGRSAPPPARRAADRRSGRRRRARRRSSRWRWRPPCHRRVRIEVAAVDEGLEIEHVAGFAPQQHHVVQRQERDRRAAAGGAAAPSSRRRRSAAHRPSSIASMSCAMSLRQHVGQKSQAAAIDAQQRDFAPDHQPRGLQQGAVAADGDHVVRPRPRARRAAPARTGAARSPGSSARHQHLDAAPREHRQHRRGALGDSGLGRNCRSGRRFSGFGFMLRSCNMPKQGGQRRHTGQCCRLRRLTTTWLLGAMSVDIDPDRNR